MTDIEVKLNAWQMNYETVLAVQGESEGRTLVVTLIDRTGQTDGSFNAESIDRPIDLTGVSARLYCIKPDGTVTFSDGTITDAENGIVSFVLPYQATTAAGEVPCQILLTKADNSTVKAIGLVLNVQESNLDDAVESSSEYSSLVTALNQISSSVTAAQTAVVNANTAIGNINATNQSVATAESARVTAENGRVSAESTRASNESTRQAQETSRVSAETSRVTAENSRQTSTQTAISNAGTATTNANTAADRANTAAQNAEDAIAGQLDPSIDARIAVQKNQPNGIAGLDGSGKVAAAQLPAMDYVPNSQKAAANGVATLDANGKLGQMPTKADVGLGSVDNTADVSKTVNKSGYASGLNPTTAPCLVNVLILPYKNSTIPAGLADNTLVFRLDVSSS